MKTDFVARLTAAGVLTGSSFSGWQDVGPLFAVLDVMRGEGATAVIKFDGGRDGDVYTVIVSGGKLAADVFREDGGDVRALLESAIQFYNEKVWRLDTSSV